MAINYLDALAHALGDTTPTINEITEVILDAWRELSSVREPSSIDYRTQRGYDNTLTAKGMLENALIALGAHPQLDELLEANRRLELRLAERRKKGGE